MRTNGRHRQFRFETFESRCLLTVVIDLEMHVPVEANTVPVLFPAIRVARQAADRMQDKIDTAPKSDATDSSEPTNNGTPAGEPTNVIPPGGSVRIFTVSPAGISVDTAATESALRGLDPERALSLTGVLFPNVDFSQVDLSSVDIDGEIKLGAEVEYRWGVGDEGELTLAWQSGIATFQPNMVANVTLDLIDVDAIVGNESSDGGASMGYADTADRWSMYDGSNANYYSHGRLTNKFGAANQTMMPDNGLSLDHDPVVDVDDSFLTPNLDMLGSDALQDDALTQNQIPTIVPPEVMPPAVLPPVLESINQPVATPPPLVIVDDPSPITPDAAPLLTLDPIPEPAFDITITPDPIPDAPLRALQPSTVSPLVDRNGTSQSAEAAENVFSPQLPRIYEQTIAESQITTVTPLMPSTIGTPDVSPVDSIPSDIPAGTLAGIPMDLGLDITVSPDLPAMNIPSTSVESTVAPPLSTPLSVTPAGNSSTTSENRDPAIISVPLTSDPIDADQAERLQMIVEGADSVDSIFELAANESLMFELPAEGDPNVVDEPEFTNDLDLGHETRDARIEPDFEDEFVDVGAIPGPRGDISQIAWHDDAEEGAEAGATPSYEAGTYGSIRRLEFGESVAVDNTDRNNSRRKTAGVQRNTILDSAAMDSARSESRMQGERYDSDATSPPAAANNWYVVELENDLLRKANAQESNVNAANKPATAALQHDAEAVSNDTFAAATSNGKIISYLTMLGLSFASIVGMSDRASRAKNSRVQDRMTDMHLPRDRNNKVG